MFNKLRLKLTLANLIVVVIIFIIVFTGVYVTMYQSIIRQSEQLMNVLTYSIINEGELKNPKMLGILGNQAFIVAEMSYSGQVTSYISTPFIAEPTKEYVDELVKNAIAQNGKIRILSNSYRNGDSTESKTAIIIMGSGTIQTSTGKTYISRLVKKENNSLSLVFINIDYEHSLLKSLRFNLVIVALAGLSLVFAGSLFMAGRAVKPIKAAWEKQKNFVADASHELRTPLSVMQANLELVMENKEDTVESQTKWLENIYFENKHMTRLVVDLLLLARADSGQKLLEMENFSLSTSVEKAAKPFIPLAEEKQIKIDLLIDPDVDFYGDESKIKQLVAILIDNAAKYTPSGGSISLKLKNNVDNVEIIISDTGVGIDKEYLEKIFERFYRVDKARSSENGGTGLGLSIASWIVKEHRGTINVDSVVGEGTTFKVVFPINTKQKLSCINN
jgi:signal transduction histidine kinase